MYSKTSNTATRTKGGKTSAKAVKPAQAAVTKASLLYRILEECMDTGATSYVLNDVADEVQGADDCIDHKAAGVGCEWRLGKNS